ncbi:hypothetical protein CHLNCDRAFT_54058 [Chlorella variabilis]|uniref:STI1/HOP DP domain-containing protein n=1 Tax=Chlorella variabilis TaxID=554065 RepID=E1ZMB6_CHLVA|nr:hypothetical protein CHLNCDRAFT_54058 [Chlorella variabilis]EFN53080.1 hypothetical protein CHLNCDRAFT_54058 [Chlorella variabilis]|eukprot:XP_005845182.1 hypothetical protein CHLNCDRAFT_54058 [Chlorella variabilis]
MPATEESQNRLFKAAEAGDVQEFQEAAAAIDEDVRELHADNGANVLHIAAHAGHTELCAYLLDDLHLDAGADPDAKDEHGHTPARVAGMHGHRQLVEALLRRGGGGGGANGGDEGGGVRRRRRRRRRLGASVVRIPEPEVADETLSDSFKRKGNEFFVKGDYEGAAQLYGLALSHWTKSATVWSNRAACYLRLERYEKALQDAQIARTLDPAYVKAAQLQPDNEEFIRLTKEAIVEGRKEFQAQQAAQQQQQQQAVPAAAAAGEP